MTKPSRDNSEFPKADALAAQYDESALQFGWHTPEVIFGLAHEHLQAGQSVLDLGIGTGLSAVPFAKAGLEVYGVDGSQKMLERCADKCITVELRQHDIRSAPLPYGDGSFDHVIASGVFHLIGKLDEIFRETARVMRGGGVFAFSVEVLDAEHTSGGTLVFDGVLGIVNEKSGVSSFQHSDSLVQDLLDRNGFIIKKTLDYVAYQKTAWADERSFRAYVARG